MKAGEILVIVCHPKDLKDKIAFFEEDVRTKNDALKVAWQAAVEKLDVLDFHPSLPKWKLKLEKTESMGAFNVAHYFKYKLKFQHWS